MPPQKTQKRKNSTCSNSQISQTPSQFASRAFGIPAQSASTQQQQEDAAFAEKKLEATRLEIQAKHGTITPQGQERLTLLQAKMHELLQTRLENAAKYGHNIERIALTRPDSAPPVQAQLTIWQPGDKYEQEADETARQNENKIHSKEIAESGQALQRQLIPAKVNKEELSDQSKQKVTSIKEQTSQPSIYEVVNEEQEEARLKGLDLIFANTYLRKKQNVRHPLSQLHQRIIKKAQQTQADKNTDEWNLGRAVLSEAGILDINKFKNQWVCGYKNVINAAAKEFNILSRLLAAVAWREVGGDPHFLDDLGYVARSLGFKDKPVDETSFGDLSIQVRRAAESLGYRPEQLGERQRYKLLESLQEPRQNIFIAAKHLSDLRDNLFRGKQANELTEKEQMAIAGAYNGGPQYSMEELWKYGYAGGYGRSAFNGLKQSGCFK